MAHGYRTLQNWNKWLNQSFLGRKVIEAEREIIQGLIKQHYGKQAVLIGVPLQSELIAETEIPYRTLMTSLVVTTQNQHPVIEADLSDLPIQSGCVDLVVIPHTLEFVDSPRQLIAEACRIIKPEGLIVVCTFNPYSAWGLKRAITKDNKSLPHGSHLISPRLIKNWLQLADFVIESHQSALFRPPVLHETFYDRMRFIERLGSWCFPKAGGINIVAARAKVIPMTPIKMKWKQQLGNIRITPAIPGNIATNSSTSSVD